MTTVSPHIRERNTEMSRCFRFGPLQPLLAEQAVEALKVTSACTRGGTAVIPPSYDLGRKGLFFVHSEGSASM